MHIDNQRTMAAQQNNTLAHQFETRPSTRGGTGLFSVIAQGAGHCIHYYGQFYENGHAVAEAQLADSQYIIARGGGGSMEAPHFDGAAITDQLATRANHSGNSPNAELVWDEDFGDSFLFMKLVFIIVFLCFFYPLFCVTFKSSQYGLKQGIHSTFHLSERRCYGTIHRTGHMSRRGSQRMPMR